MAENLARRIDRIRISPVVTEESVRLLLNGIVDPCSANIGAPAGLVDMGLVRSIAITPSLADNTLVDVTIILGLTEPGCMMGYPFLRESEARVRALPGVGEVSVTLDTRSLWTEDDLDPDYRVKLRAARNAKLTALKLTRPPVARWDKEVRS